MASVVETRLVQPSDYWRFRFVQGAALSPDGKTAVYALLSTDTAKDEDHVALWLVDVGTSASRRLTNGVTRDWSPQWSPDGKQVAFLSTRGSTPQVYVIPIDGGEARALTAMKQGVGGGPAWSPDGRRIAYTSGPAEPPDPKKPYRVTGTTYRFDAMGYLDRVVQDIYVIGLDGGEAKRLTSGGGQKGNLVWSPDGTEILFTAAVLPGEDSMVMRPQMVDMEGAVRDPLKGWGTVALQAWMPDGRRLAFVGTEAGKPIGSKTDLWLVDKDGGVPVCRTAASKLGVGGGVQPDIPAAPLPSLLVSPDGESAIAAVHEGGAIGVARVSLSGAESSRIIVSGDRCAIPVDLRSGRLLYAVSTMQEPIDLSACNADGTGEVRLTRVNEAVLSEIKAPACEHLLFRGTDGAQVEGWILLPPEGRAPFPTILYVHGGPHSAFGHMYSFDFQMLAGAGYAVLFVNHRASTGYGDEFSTAIKGDWGNLDYGDLMAGVDEAIARGLADADRLGVCGISGGGNLSCWIVGQTDRFKAAVPENPVTNWVSFFGVSDIGPGFSREELGGLPHEIPEVYTLCSPITYAHRCKTPTLLVQGEADYRCPAEQSEQFYAVLKANGCTVEMLRLPDSPHAGAIMGPVPIRRAQNDALLAWMNKYVMGK